MSKRWAGDLDPHAVLSGRVEVTAVELVDLVHRVNPTGRDLPGPEAERRYALKSRLQSLLVRRFGAELTVLPDPDHEGTVSLIHRGQGRDACHAVIAALDDDARSWVQLQVDLGPPASTVPPPAKASSPPVRESIVPPSSAASPDSLVRRADRAVDSFDFERARGQLARALAASGGAPGPAEAFLALLVDTLGDDAAALALEPSLSSEAMAHPHVRGLLALAAARSGGEPGAMILLRGADADRALQVLAALAAGAIAARDEARASAHLADLRRRDPGHPAIPGLTADLGSLRSAARAPAEAEIQALLSAGHDADVARKAAEVLARWPESEAARRALRVVEERRRHDEAARLAAEAEAALAAGQRDVALAALARAAGVALGPEREAVERRVREIDADARARREVEAAEEARRLLAAEDGREGLAAYLDLPEAARAEVRAGVARAAADRLRRLDLARGALRARVEAVVALDHALNQLAADPEAARALIAPHLAALERVPEAKQILRDAEACVAAQRLARARAAAAAARAAFTEGRMDAAFAGLEDSAIRDLPEPELAEVHALRDAVTPVVGRGRRAAELGRLATAGRLFEARDLASELATESEGDERARWEEETRRLQEAIQRAFRVEVDAEARPFDAGRDPFPVLWFRTVPRWLLDDGRAFVLAEGGCRRVVVSVVEREGLRVRATVTLRAPEPFDLDWHEVIGEVVWLLSRTGAAVALLLDTWEVLLFRPSVRRPNEDSSRWLPYLPSGIGEAGPSQPRFLWTAIPGQDVESADFRVFDLEGRRPPRVLPGVKDVEILAGLPEPRVLAFEEDAVVLYEDRGVPVPEGRLMVPGGKPLNAALRPDGEGLVVLIEQPARGDAPATLAWVDVPFDGPPRAPRPIPGLSPDTSRIARAAGEAIIVVTAFTRGGPQEWVAIGIDVAGERAAPPPLVEIWRAPCPAKRLMLITDETGQRAVGWESRPEGALLVDLGRAPPAVSEWPVDILPAIGLGNYKHCFRHNRAVHDFKHKVEQVEASRRPVFVRKIVRAPQQNPMLVVLMVFQLEDLGAASAPEMARLFAWLEEHAPRMPDAMLLQAERHAIAGRWREVVDLLAPLAATSEPASELCPFHAHHLSVMGHLHLGDVDRAREILARIGVPETPCPFAALHDLTTPFPDPLPPEAWGRDRPFVVQIAGAARHADACLARGDAETAISVLSQDPFSTLGLVQLLARLAEAWLCVPVTGKATRTHKGTALARFVAAHAEKSLEHRDEMLIPGATWDTGRLDDLSARASAWLDAEG